MKVEEEKKDGKVLYEGHVKKGDEMLGIRVDAAGKVIDKHSRAPVARRFGGLTLARR